MLYSPETKYKSERQLNEGKQQTAVNPTSFVFKVFRIGRLELLGRELLGREVCDWVPSTLKK